MSSIIEWFKVGSLLGIPRTGWAILTLMTVVDVLCAHSKNPKLNHAAGALALLIQKVLDLFQVSKIPMFGPALFGFLNVVIGLPAGGIPAPEVAPAPITERPTPPDMPKGPPKAA
jgi:hypothetical protein